MKRNFPRISHKPCWFYARNLFKVNELSRLRFFFLTFLIYSEEEIIFVSFLVLNIELYTVLMFMSMYAGYCWIHACSVLAHFVQLIDIEQKGRSRILSCLYKDALKKPR